MIKLFLVNGRHAPNFVCDVCSLRIENAKDGLALSALRSSDTGVLSIEEVVAASELFDPEEYEIFHVHKGKCQAVLEDRFKTERAAVGGDGLDEHLYYLTRNLGLTLEDLKAVEDDMD